MSDKVKVVIVVAMSRNKRAIGHTNELLWHIPDDLKRFKEKTLGHPIIMGRKTFESIVAMLGKPLPGRENIVITRNRDYTFEGATIVGSLDEAFARAEASNPTQIHIGGGAEIYKQALPFVDELYVTYVDDEPESDTFFPELTEEFMVTHMHEPRTYNGLSYQWVDYSRK
jgi:dihydrofolate reductase